MKKFIEETPELIAAWKQHPDVIRRFLSDRSQYEQLGSEIAYILTKRLAAKGIEVSAITHRTKTLNSFVEKISRKKYKNPLKEITDFSGVRVVYLYSSDLSEIVSIIQSEFKVIETVDKMENQGTEKFGYGAIHFLVKLGKKSSGARYEDLKDHICEIQVRTVLQDAWAIIDHHLIYKHETDVPRVLIRKLNSLAGLFETADDQFEQIRFERQKYLEKINESTKFSDEFLDQEINMDTVVAFLKYRFPSWSEEPRDGHISVVLSDLDRDRYSKLRDLDDLLLRTKKAREAFHLENKLDEPLFHLAIAVGLDDMRYRSVGFSDEEMSLMNKYQHLVEKKFNY